MSRLQEEARVVWHQPVALQTYLLRLESPQIAARAQAGQFVMLKVRDGTDPLLRRPLSFHRILGNEGEFEILYRVVGYGTYWLSQCTPGSTLNLLGPLGNGFDIDPKASGTEILVAGGIGIAPLFELLVRLAADVGARDLHLFYGARTARELLSPEVFANLGVTIHWSTDDGTYGHHGFVTQLLRDTMKAQESQPRMLYACGPLPMQHEVARWALANHVPTQLSLESLMACGVGACLGCALPADHPDDPSEDHYLHVCKDGPIFSAGSIQWHKIQLHRPSLPISLYS